jgi:hypothetical protein
MNSGYETADAPRRVSFSQNQNQPAQQKVEVLK